MIKVYSLGLMISKEVMLLLLLSLMLFKAWEVLLNSLCYLSELYYGSLVKLQFAILDCILLA